MLCSFQLMGVGMFKNGHSTFLNIPASINSNDCTVNPNYGKVMPKVVNPMKITLSPRRRLWLARVLIALVLIDNLQAAILFLLQPDVYAPAFELSGVAGAGMIQGMAILFLMWNVPYVVALSHPLKQRISLIEAVVMQAIGFFGETFLLLSFPPGHAVLVDSVGRFILFDGIGLGILVVAFVVISFQ